MLQYTNTDVKIFLKVTITSQNDPHISHTTHRRSYACIINLPIEDKIHVQCENIGSEY